jgi:3-(3-hydroxy-phenyl)propionate hydroxylase
MLDRKGQPIWLLEALGGQETILYVSNGDSPPCSCRVLTIGHDLIDGNGFFEQRFDASPGSAYLVRPDQHLAARWRHPDSPMIERATRRLRGFDGGAP